MSTFQAENDLDIKGKVVSLNGYTMKIFLALNPIGLGGHLTLFQLPSHLGKYIQAKNDLDLKTKVVSLNGWTLKNILDLNPIGLRGHLTVF